MNFFLQPGEGILLKYESGWVDEATIITPKTKTVLDDVTAVILTSRRLVLECRETVEAFALSDLVVYDNRIQLFANQDYEIELYFRDARVQLPRMESSGYLEDEYCDLWIDSIADAYNGLFPASPDEPYEDEEADEDEDEDEEYDEDGNEDGKTYNDAEIEQIRYAARSFLEITNKLAEDDREILLEAVGLAVGSARSEQQSDEEIPSKNPEAEEDGSDFMQSFNRVMKKLSKKEQDIVYAVIGHVAELTEAGLLDVDADDAESPLSPVSDPDRDTRSVKPAAPPPPKSRSRKDVRPRCPRCRCTYGENDIYCGFCGWKLPKDEKAGGKKKQSTAKRDKKAVKEFKRKLKSICLACIFAGIAFAILAAYLELYAAIIGGIAIALGSELLYAYLDREKPRRRKK